MGVFSSIISLGTIFFYIIRTCMDVSSMLEYYLPQDLMICSKRLDGVASFNPEPTFTYLFPEL